MNLLFLALIITRDELILVLIYICNTLQSIYIYSRSNISSHVTVFGKKVQFIFKKRLYFLFRKD